MNRDHARTNSVMIHVIVLSAKVRRDERLNLAIMANSRHCNIFGPTFGFKNHSNLNLRNKITKNNCHPHTNFYILTREKIPPPHTSPILAHSLLSDWLWAPLKEQMSDTASTDSLLHLLGSSNKITHTH